MTSDRIPAAGPVTLVHDQTERLVAHTVEVAATRATRRKGLLGRTALDRSSGLLIVPCLSVHTAFMQFPIDVAFIGRDGRVLRAVHNLPPWRIAVCLRAHAVVELAAGVLREKRIHCGDRLSFGPPPSAAARLDA
jgi:uncharacterized membrane protein (UPF0127 family)